MGLRYSLPAIVVLAAAVMGTAFLSEAASPEPSTLSVKPAVRRTASLDTIIPPPEAPVYEVDPGERPGYMWTSGYWDWDGKQHIWQSGRWVKLRTGYVWVASTWAQRGDKWHLYPAHWEKDQDAADEEPVAAAEEAAPAPAAAPKAKAAKRKSPRYTDYNNKKRWPRVIGNR